MNKFFSARRSARTESILNTVSSDNHAEALFLDCICHNKPRFIAVIANKNQYLIQKIGMIMLRLSLEALEILDAIARRGSFAAAAAEVHRVPSAVT